MVVEEWIHACHIPKLEDKTDAVVIKTHRHHDDGRITPELVVINKPSRSFYITRKNRQTHEFKKERESIQYLDRYDVPNYRLTEELSKALNGYNGTKSYTSLAQLCNSPYVYGADIHIETLIKHNVMKKFEASGKMASRITTGFLDIETDVIGGDGSEPNIITVTHENKIYTAILEKFFTVKQSDGSFKRGDLDTFITFSKQTLDHHITELLDDHTKKNPNSLLKKLVAETPFEYEYYVGKSPLDIITWIFSRIHQNRTDFLGVWNLDFDIPKIIAAIKTGGGSLEEIFCPPELDKKYKYVRYQPDDKVSDSIYKKWHWLHSTSYTQFIDSMCLYSMLRIVKGKEVSMKLDDILKINDLGGKLTFKDDDPITEDLAGLEWHRYMQLNEAYKYIVYNQFDCISLQLMEWKNNDITSMAILGGVSRLSKWSRQTRKMADDLYFDALLDKMVTASPGQNMETPFDLMINNVGGAVLRPERTTDIGLKIFSDRPDLTTMLHNMVGDVDFSQMYPTVTIVGNISKETKVSTGLEIEGLSREASLAYYSLVISLKENAVLIGTKYYGLKNYQDMNTAFTNYLKTK